MEGLFNQIMDLGEEEGDVASPSGLASVFSGAMTSAFSGNGRRFTTAEPTATSYNAAGTSESYESPSNTSATHSADGRHPSSVAPSASDNTAAAQLRHNLQLQKKRYDEVLADLHRLRSEYDAYRLRMDHVVRQYKQQALQDKHMLEELRLAGVTGSMDEAYVNGLKRQLGELQQQLNESMAVAEKAYRRQREAEEARASTEKAKREELEALAGQIDSFRSAASPPAAEMTTGKGECGYDAPAAATPDENEEAEKEGEAGEEKLEGKRQKKEATPGAATPNLLPLQMQAQLALRQAEITELRAQLQQRESTYQQKLEEQLQDLETLRKEIEQFKQRESALKASQVVMVNKAEAEYAAKETALRRELDMAREQVLKASAAQSSQRATQELLAAQQREHEERMHTKERELQATRASMKSLQADVEATHAELREMEMTLHDARTESRQLQAKADQAKAELLHCKQLLASREEAMFDAEKERQKLRAMLQQEEEETLRIRQQLMQLQRMEVERGVGTATAARSTEVSADQYSTDSAATEEGLTGHVEDVADTSRLGSVIAAQRRMIQSLHNRMENLEKELATREVALRRQQAQTQDISAARIEVIRLKEEANARVAQLKDKISRLENELAAARHSSDALAASAVAAMGAEDDYGAGEAGLLTSSMERHRFLLEAKRSADSYRSLRVRHLRAAFFAVLFLVVGMTLYATFSLAPPSVERI